jgi:hypothetical protein
VTAYHQSGSLFVLPQVLLPRDFAAVLDPVPLVVAMYAAPLTDHRECQIPKCESEQSNSRDHHIESRIRHFDYIYIQPLIYASPWAVGCLARRAVIQVAARASRAGARLDLRLLHLQDICLSSIMSIEIRSSSM